MEKVQHILSSLGFEHITLISLFLVLFFPIAIVYVLGRGLNIIQTKLTKNAVAISLVMILSILEVFSLIPSRLQSILFLCSVGFFMYVVVWQKFYSRADKFLDKKIGEDEEENGNGFIVKKKKSKR